MKKRKRHLRNCACRACLTERLAAVERRLADERTPPAARDTLKAMAERLGIQIAAKK